MTKRNKINQQKNQMKSHIQPKTDGQMDYMRSIIDNEITICTGPAGSGKSACCVGVAAEKLYIGDFDKLIITRPVVGCGKKSLGALPGDIREKMLPYLAPIHEHLKQFLGENLFREFEQYKRIEIAPLEFMRGSNFNDCFVILDEAQNATIDELIMFITRFGENCKMVINGDPAQTDLDSYLRGIDKIINRCRNVAGFGIVELTTADIVRSDIVRRFLDAMREY